MSIFETPLGQCLAEALQSRNANDIATCVDDILDAVWKNELEPEDVQATTVELQRHAEFDHVVAIGDAALAKQQATVETRRRYCQALIEKGALHAAELELERLATEEGVSPKEKGEALGLIGRLRKQRYIAGGTASDLQDAIESYRQAYEGGTDPAWHGVNLVALMQRAADDGADLPEGLPGAEQLRTTVLGVTREKPENQRTIWDRATEVETLVAAGDVAEAETVARDLVDSKYVNAFELGSLRRQLTEVWRLQPDHPVIMAISDRLLKLGQGATLQVADSPMQLEKIFGDALPVGYNTLAMGLRCAQSVCKIADAAGEGWGTGFLITGNLISDDLGEKPIIATNAHVVTQEEGIGQLRPAEVHARFDVLKGENDEPLVLSGMREIWSSIPTHCDVTLLEFDADMPGVPEPITAAPALPNATEGAFVYVVGHPAGGGLKLSIRGNDLLAYDDARSKVHYTAPTEPGSSGSPVFTSAWQLMAVHHAGSKHMRRIGAGEDGSYQANEGITLDAIRGAYAEAMGG